MKWIRKLTGISNRYRYSYWSSSRLAKYLRTKVGIESPSALTLEDWEDWRNVYKAKSPVMYWVTESLLNNLQDIVYFSKDMFENIEYKLTNIFKDKTHYLQTKLKRGQYYEIDYRLLYAVFESLVTFVEVEKGNSWWKEGKVTARERGLAYLDWEINETDPGQADAAKEIKELYLWWKDEYSFRPDIDYKDNNWFEAKEARYKFDTEQIVRVIRLRGHLWT